MSKIQKHFRGNIILYRMIGGTLLLAALTVVLLTFLLSRAAEQSMREEIFQSQQQSLKRIANTVDFRAEYANYLMQSANRDKSISQLFYATEGKDTLASLRALSQLRQSVKQLHSIYIYNEHEHQLYCSTGTNPYLVSGVDGFEDKDFINILENVGNYPKYSPMLRYVVDEKPNGQRIGEYVYTYLLYDQYGGGAIKNILAFNFHLGWMGDALRYIANDKDDVSDLWIVNRERRIVYSDSGEMIGAYSDAESFPDAIFSASSGYLLTGEGDDREMLVYATPVRSGYGNWTFLSRSQYDDMIAPINRLREGVYVIALTVMLVSVLMTVYLSGMLYRPVRQTIDSMEALKIEQAQKREMERTLCLHKLFRGELPQEPSAVREALLENAVVYDVDGDNLVAIICIDYMNSYLVRFRKNAEETNRVIEDIVRESVSALYPEHLLASMRDGLWSVCVPAREEQAGSMRRLFERVNEHLNDKLELSVSIAVSSVGHAAGDIPFLYAEALNTLSFRFLVGQNHLLTPDGTEEYGKEKFDYPHDAEEKLLACMFTGKAQEAEGLYEQFVDQIRYCAVSDIRMAFILLASAVKRASSNTVTEASSVLMEFDQFYHKLQTLETLDEVNQMFLHLIWEITENTLGYAQKKYEKLIQQMKDYAAAHYGRMSLSMNEVADHVDMSAAYLGRLFKQLTGETFTEYLTKYRLDAACDMLRNTNKTVNEITEAVGFTNSSYFYIVFKKNLGCTPNQYRMRNE